MAIQNFIAGGYYGKLGETVGQRWKNKRTVRVYVVPHDPKTPNQLLHRNYMRSAVPYAQEGLRFNKGAPCWKYDDKTEWQARMGTAIDRVKAGFSGASLIPLFPDGYTPAVQLLNIVAIPLSAGKYAFYTSSDVSFDTARHLLICIQAKDNTTGETVNLVIETDTETSGQYVFYADTTGYTIEEGAQIYGVSNDDSSNNDVMVYIAPQALATSAEITLDDIVLTVNESGHIVLTSQKLSLMSEVHTLNFKANLVNMLTDAYEEVSLSVQNVAGETEIDCGAGGVNYAVWEESYIKPDSMADIEETYFKFTFTQVANAVSEKQARDFDGLFDRAYYYAYEYTKDLTKSGAYLGVAYNGAVSSSPFVIADCVAPNGMTLTTATGGGTETSYALTAAKGFEFVFANDFDTDEFYIDIGALIAYDSEVAAELGKFDYSSVDVALTAFRLETKYTYTDIPARAFEVRS